MVSYKFKVTDPIGFHARPAAKLVEVVKKYDAEAFVHHGEKKASLKSIISLMALGIRTGTEVEITVEGPQANDCLAAIKTVIVSEKLGQ